MIEQKPSFAYLLFFLLYLLGYDALMGKYMVDSGLDVSSDQSPPKDLFIEVRVIKEAGEVQVKRTISCVEQLIIICIVSIFPQLLLKLYNLFDYTDHLKQ